MVYTVYKKIIARLENDRGLQEEMGKLAGYSTGSNFGKAISEGRSIEKLDGLVKVIRTLFPEDADQLLIQYANELDTKKMTIKLLLEYATLYYLTDLKQVIISRLKECSKSDSKEWARVYEIDHQVEVGTLSPYEGINKLNDEGFSKIETKIYCKIAKLYCLYDLKSIKVVKLMIEDIEKDIEQINNKFLRNAYGGRIYRVKVGMNLHMDKLGNLLESSFNIEDALEPTKTKIYLQIGNSYMLKSYEKAIHFLNKAMEYKNSHSENQILQSLNFVNLLWDKPQNFKPDGTKSNELFYYVKSGNKSMANRLIEQIDFDKYNDDQKAFHCFYLGLLYNDVNYFYDSIEYFNSYGEKFFKQIPLAELKKRGEKDIVIKALSA
jgi:hypothetical protein